MLVINAQIHAIASSIQPNPANGFQKYIAQPIINPKPLRAKPIKKRTSCVVPVFFLSQINVPTPGRIKFTTNKSKALIWFCERPSFVLLLFLAIVLEILDITV